MAEINEYRKKKKHERNKAWRENLKRNHQCTKCTKTDERTLAGYILCKTCNDKRKEVYHKWSQTEHGRQVNREKRRRLGYRRVNRGLCVGCGKNPPEPDKLFCTDCLRKASEQNKARKERLKEQCST